MPSENGKQTAMELLQELRDRVVALETWKANVLAAFGGGPGGGGEARGGAVAEDAELDSQRGDPRIKYGLKEKYWPAQPDPFVGKTYSQTTPEYLDATAKYLDACGYVFERKDTEAERKKAHWKYIDAGRARGWAKRLRAGWQPPASTTPKGNPFAKPSTDTAGAPASAEDDDVPWSSESGGAQNDDEIPF